MVRGSGAVGGGDYPDSRSSSLEPSPGVSGRHETGSFAAAAPLDAALLVRAAADVSLGRGAPG